MLLLVLDCSNGRVDWLMHCGVHCPCWSWLCRAHAVHLGGRLDWVLLLVIEVAVEFLERSWRKRKMQKRFFPSPLGQISSILVRCSDGFLVGRGSILNNSSILWNYDSSWEVGSCCLKLGAWAVRTWELQGAHHPYRLHGDSAYQVIKLSTSEVMF
jgi:hypothetical protein